MREKRDLYNINLENTGVTYYKGDPILENYYPMVVMIAIENSEGKFLIQKRSKAKGGYFGITGGHPKSGESCLEGLITEVKEELGIDISNEKIIEFEHGCDGTDCYRMYYTKLDLDITKLTLQEEEVEYVKWFSIGELKSMIDNGIIKYKQADFIIKYANFLNK